MSSTNVPNVKTRHLPRATVAIAQIRGIVSIADVASKPAGLRNVFELVRSTMIAHGGDVVQMAGDACVTVFESSEGAVDAALNFVRRVDEICTSLQARVGVATGRLLITTVDSGAKLNSITGAAFREADHLLKQATKRRTSILICPESVKLTSHQTARLIIDGPEGEEAREAFIIVSTSHSAPAPR